MNANPEDKEFASPNSVPWMVYRFLHELPRDMGDRDAIRMNGLMSVFLGMAAIESFTNIFFRVVADETQFARARNNIIAELKNHGSTAQNLSRWTTLAFGHAIDVNDARWTSFKALNERRNALVHFKSSHETVRLPAGVVIQGLANMAAFSSLKSDTPSWVANCVRGVVEMVGERRGLGAKQLPNFLHYWLGIVPDLPAPTLGQP